MRDVEELDFSFNPNDFYPLRVLANLYNLSNLTFIPDEEGQIIKRKLMDILACPIDKYYPLELHVFEEKDEIVEGVIICPKCLRWYPIREEIPEMLPDELREEKDELPFLRKWKKKIPRKILSEGKPFNLKSEI